MARAKQSGYGTITIKTELVGQIDSFAGQLTQKKKVTVRRPAVIELALEALKKSESLK